MFASGLEGRLEGRFSLWLGLAKGEGPADDPADPPEPPSVSGAGLFSNLFIKLEIREALEAVLGLFTDALVIFWPPNFLVVPFTEGFATLLVGSWTLLLLGVFLLPRAFPTGGLVVVIVGLDPGSVATEEE